MSASRLCLLASLVLIFVVGVSGVTSAAGRPRLAWELLEHRSPQRICAAEPVEVEIRLRNAGTAVWSKNEGDRLSYHWLDADGGDVVFDGVRTELPGYVAPGEVVTLQARVVAPDRSGPHVLRWEMVRENVEWYGAPQPGGASADVTVDVGERAFAWELVDAETPTSIAANGVANAKVRVRNTGCATWSPTQDDALAYHIWDADGRMVERDGVRTPVPGEVRPQEVVDLVATIHAPNRPGRHMVEWEMIRERVTWYGGGVIAGGFEVPRPELMWSVVAQTMGARAHAEELVTVRLRLRNEGSATWSEELGDQLSYHWLAPSRKVVEHEGLRTPFPHPVRPGEHVDVEARVQAPREPGPYFLQWEPVREGVAWYGPPVDGEVMAQVPVAVDVARLGWELLEADVPTNMWVGRMMRIPIRVRNAGAEAWSREQQDHLSYRWLDEQGRVVEDEGLRTELPGPVAPGESVEVHARVRAPRSPGRHVLELGMVREQVAWHGPPQGGRPHRFSIAARWLFVFYDLGLFLGVALLALLRGRLRPPPRSRLWVVHGLAPVAWAALALYFLVESFADLSGFELWRRAPTLSLSGAVLLVAPLFVAPARARPWAAFALVTACFVLVLGDLAYMRFFGSIMPLGAAAASAQILDTGASVVALLRPACAWMVFLPLGGLVLAARWPAPGRSERPPGRGRRLVSWLVALLVLTASLSAVKRLYRATTGDLARRVFSDQNNVGRLGVLNTHVFELARTVKEWVQREGLDSDERQRIGTFFAERARAAKSAAADPPQNANVLLIQVEAFQQWVVGARVRQQEVTPFLNRAHERGLYYPNVFDQTSHGRTSDAEYLVLSSNHPLYHGALCFLRDESHFVTLAHVLRDRGYTTLSAHPYKRGYWNRAVIHPRYGFERSLFRRELGEGTVVGWGLADGVFFERMIPELEALPRPFFALLITLGLHHPYTQFPRDLSPLDVGVLEGTSLGNYLLAMSYFDASLETFLGELRARGLLESTIVVVYGDHDARLETPPEVLALAGVDRWDPSVPARIERVPLWIMLPDGGAHGIVSTIGGQVDIGPTLLHHMGIERPSCFLGRPLLAGRAGFAAMPDGSAASPDRIFVATGQGIGGNGSCFDFPGGAARPRKDCDALFEHAREELEISRAVLDHDLFRELAGLSQ